MRDLRRNLRTTSLATRKPLRQPGLTWLGEGCYLRFLAWGSRMLDRGGFGSKFHPVTDGRGTPLTVEVTTGQVYEATQVETVFDGIAISQSPGRPRKQRRTQIAQTRIRGPFAVTRTPGRSDT